MQNCATYERKKKKREMKVVTVKKERFRKKSEKETEKWYADRTFYVTINKLKNNACFA